MISKVKKNKIDLFQLKNFSDLKNVEKTFDTFITKLLKKKTKYFFPNKKCACNNKNYLHKVKIGSFDYLKCSCGTYFINPMINDSTLNLIYSSKGPYSLYRKKFIENKKKKHLRVNHINKRKVLQLLTFLKMKNRKILDFGCGDGSFLRVCNKYGFKNLHGIDSKFDRSIKKDGIFFYNSLKELDNNLKFDCITLWGVLEHLNNPLEFSKKILKHLKRKGFLLLEVPNSDSLLMKYVILNKEKTYRFLEPGRHLYFFSKLFFKIFAKKNKMNLLDIETNGLDFQTIIGPTNKSTTKHILKLQEILDYSKSSDHMRVLMIKR